ncbi:MAG: 50S ribosomal protein L3, partial [Candidatus Falkowbacteria bacterium]
RVQAGPCTVVQVKGDDKDGYSAVQVGFGERKEKNIAKPQLKHMKKAGVKSMFLREFRISSDTPQDAKERQLKIGDKIDVSTFEAGDNIQVEGVSKGKGFQGVVKRHGFHGHNKTHGTKDQVRMSGSIGSTGPAHVFKGMRMSGRMGGDQVTVKNSEVVEVDKENNILFVKGAVPGARNGLVLISGEGELMITQKHENTETQKHSASPQNTKTQKTRKHENTETQKHENTENTKTQKTQKHENTENTETRKHENTENTETQKHENKEENIEKVVVEAAEKVGEIKEIKKEEVKDKDSKEEKKK